MVEYIRLDQPSVIYSKKQLLQSQLESLTIIQRVKKYHFLRNEELILKIALKNKIDELKSEIIVFEKFLPKVAKPIEEELEVHSEKQTKRNALEEEINAIRAKLAELQE